MSVTLADLHDKWLDAVWAEFCLAYERQHMDASDTPDRYHDKLEADGVDVYLSNLYLNGSHRSWYDAEVDALSAQTELAARVYVTARDEGMPAAMLVKLAGGVQ